ncbi:DUF817 domain-containing protein [Bacillaceae bacterium S4-13-56]
MDVTIQTAQEKNLTSKCKRIMKQLFRFGWEQALSCVFPVVIFASLALTQAISLPFLPRYDWLLIIFLVMQWGMVKSGLETRDELKVITLFHLIGLALEVFKVHMGSWSYPEDGYFKLFGVPLYSGFMYASVASYLCQAWRRLDVELVKWPPFPLVGIVFWKSRVNYEIGGTRYRMPIVFSFVLIGFFIWIAENIATYFGAWEYPNQTEAWSLVHIGKISSWLLLVIVSFLIVATLKRMKGKSDTMGIGTTVP